MTATLLTHRIAALVLLFMASPEQAEAVLRADEELRREVADVVKTPRFHEVVMLVFMFTRKGGGVV